MSVEDMLQLLYANLSLVTTQKTVIFVITLVKSSTSKQTNYLTPQMSWHH
jgi:hypothetical protein